MRSNQQRSVKALLIVFEAAVALVCCAYLIVYVAIALQRITHPFDLEWMEGALVDHVHRIISGEKVYVAPSLAFIPFLYPPLYYYVAALVALVTGIGLLPLRLVSFVSSIGCFLLLYRFAASETGSRKAGLVAAGMFAATYRAGDSWLDLARVDTLLLLLMLVTLYLLRFGRSTWAWALAGGLMALAALTKQTAITMAPPLVLYAVVTDRKRGLVFAGVAAAVFAMASGILELVHEGWYFFYVFKLPERVQDADAALWRPFWRGDILNVMPIALVVGAAYLLLQVRQRQRLLFYGMFSISFVGSAWVTRLHGGAASNVLIPAHIWLSVVFALAMHDIPTVVRLNHVSLLRVVMAGLCLLQLFHLRYDPRWDLPDPKEAELHRLVRLMAETKGDVLLAQHGFFPVLAGKRTNAHALAFRDLLLGGGPLGDELIREAHDALHAQRFGLIVVNVVEPWFEPELSLHYRRVGSVFDTDGLRTVTGMRTGPQWIYQPKPFSMQGH